MIKRMIKALEDELNHAKINYVDDTGTATGDYGQGFVDGIESFLEVVKDHLETTLNENQQEWYDELSNNYYWHGDVVEHALYATLTENDLPTLSRKEFCEVIKSFADKVMEGEAE